jgi:TPR repeat protein
MRLQGNVEAYFHLGVMFLKGWGTKPNVQKAQFYFNFAAKLKHVLAMYNLAMMYLASADKFAPPRKTKS